jgi:chromosome segregation ATPase
MDAPQTVAAAPASDAPSPEFLVSLEERILRAVQLVTSLRSEKQTLLSEKSQLLSDKHTLEAELASTRELLALAEQEIDSMRADRDKVKTRIETLLTQMDALGDA